MALRTRSAVAGGIFELPRMTSEAVERDTPAARLTSSRVMRATVLPRKWRWAALDTDPINAKGLGCANARACRYLTSSALEGVPVSTWRGGHADCSSGNSVVSEPSRRIASATRSALAAMVRAGLRAAEEGKKDESTIHRF